MTNNKYTMEYVKTFIENTKDYFDNNPEDKETIFLITGGTKEKLNIELFLNEVRKNNINIVENNDGSFTIINGK